MEHWSTHGVGLKHGSTHGVRLEPLAGASVVGSFRVLGSSAAWVLFFVVLPSLLLTMSRSVVGLLSVVLLLIVLVLLVIRLTILLLPVVLVVLDLVVVLGLILIASVKLGVVVHLLRLVIVVLLWNELLLR